MAKENKGSSGYPALESFIEKKVVDLEPMTESYRKVEELFRSSKSARVKASSKQVLQGYKRFFELMSELLKIKADIAQAAAKKGKAKTK